MVQLLGDDGGFLIEVFFVYQQEGILDEKDHFSGAVSMHAVGLRGFLLNAVINVKISLLFLISLKKFVQY